MTTQTAQVKNGVIALPPELRKAWEQADVFIAGSEDKISIKKLTKPALSLKQMLDEFLQAARKTKLSKPEVAQTVQEVRKQIYQ